MLKQCLVCILAAVVTFWMLPAADHFDPACIEGKNVLVTGASSGIGEEIAYHYARLGANVVITARREERLKKVIQRCKELGASSAAKYGYVVADMAKKEDAKMVIKEAVNFLGGLHHLILNHGIFDKFDFWYGTYDQLQSFEQMLQVNYVSFVHLTSYALPYLERNGQAAIGVVGSGTGKLPTAFYAAYSGSKFALDGFFSSLRQELSIAKLNVTVTLCTIGVTNTDKGDKVRGDMEQRLHFDIDEMLKWIPIGDSRETAWAVLKSTALGQTELYYPPGQNLKLAVLIRHLFPGFIDSMTESFASGTSRKQLDATKI